MAVTIALSTVLVPVGPASANISQGYVLGVDDWQNDWDDEGTISQSAYWNNNVVAMWQQILWADGELPWSGIDCWFGEQTSQATVRWKIRRSLEDDGKAGPKAFAIASLRGLRSLEGGGFRYYGLEPGRTINFWRGSDNIWTMSISGDVHKLSYTYANFQVCG